MPIPWRLAFSEAQHSVAGAVEKPWLTLLSSLLDASFLLFYGFITQPVRDNLLINANNLAQTASQALQQAGARLEAPSMTSIVMSEAVKPYTIGVVLWLVALFVVAYVLYVLFQGGVWSIANTFVGRAKAFGSHLRQFAALNAVWFLLLGGVKLVRDFLDLRSALVMSMTQQPGWTIPAYVYYAIVGILVYFMLISYGELKTQPWQHAFKHGFVRGVKHFGRLLPAIVLILIVLGLIQLILTAVGSVSPTLWFVLGIVLVLPFLTWVRIYVNKLVVCHDGIRE